ncbi:MAG: hypothetical protein PHR77_12680 [Kiritimatiellae bacterium]|nr:hypothetical protein [Kiritimatiellia bacterium]MDD5522471.1 hypothetical protein [Kiritimatiellia bacterium]
MTTTTLLALWGAILSSLVAVWDIYKWKKEGIRLSIKVAGIDGIDGKGICCEICNRGGKVTTIREVMLVTYQKNPFLRLLRMVSSTRNLSASDPSLNLPFLLVPGGVWTGKYFFSDKNNHPFNDDNYSELLEQGKLYYKVTFSHTDRPARGLVKQDGLNIFDIFG